MFVMTTTHWTESETKALIRIWGGKEMQQKLDGVVRNRNIYETISQELSKVGINRSWKQCRDRIKNLLAKYHKTKDNNRQTGNNRHSCPYYNKIDAIIGTRPMSTPPIVLQSSDKQGDKASVETTPQRSEDALQEQDASLDDSYQGSVSEELGDQQELEEEYSLGPCKLSINL